MLSTLIVNGKHRVFETAMIATEISALKVDKILVALNATVKRNVNSHC